MATGGAGRFGQIDPGFESAMSDLSIGGDELSKPIKFAVKQYGKRGSPVDLYVNFFDIKLSGNTPNYFHYNIEILKDDSGDAAAAAAPAPATGGKGGRKKAAAQQQQRQQQQQPQQQPKKDTTPKSKKMPKRLNDAVFLALLKTHKQIFNCPYPPVFDGEKNFYSTTKFQIPNNNWSGRVTIQDMEKQESFIVNVTVPEISHGQNLAQLRAKDPQVMPIELQALDIIMRNGPRLCKISLGSNFFLKYQHPQHRNYKFTLGRDRDEDPLRYGQFGHYQCAKKTEKGLVYNVDRAMAVFSYGGPLTGLIDNVFGKGAARDQLNRDEVFKLTDLVKGLKFRAMHLNYSRQFIISGLSKEPIKSTMFTLDSDGQNRKMSVLDYFKTTYAPFCQRNALNPDLPAVQVGSSRNAKYFPAEVCYLLEDEVYRRKLNPKLQGMVTRTSSQQAPFDRFQGIINHVKTLEQDNTIKVGEQSVNYLQKFGIQVNANPIQVKGRILPVPQVVYATEQIIEPREGSWDMRNSRFIATPDLGRSWGVVNVGMVYGRSIRSSVPKQKMDELIRELIRDGQAKGIGISNPLVTEYNYHYAGKGTMAKDIFSKLTSQRLRLVIFLIPGGRDEIYNEIKSVAELNLGMITQCLNQDQKYWQIRMSAQLLTNFFLKINPKCAGTNQVLHPNSKPPLLRQRLMIIGLDVTHPSPTDGLGKSIAACVGSYTKDFDRCHQRIVVQEKARKEVVNLRAIVIDLLENFKAKGNNYPTRILVYRDGIGEGDFEKVIRVELDAIKKACNDVGHPEILVTYVMVQKRHNTRFLPVRANPRDKASFQNIKPGTVVDNDIVHHTLFEFYLCSHAGMMGTSRPSKYVVLHDENQMSADELQAVTYHLCYLYPRCTKSSSIPPFVAYAHLMAKRARAYLAHLENRDGQSSTGSDQRMDVLSKAQIDDLNQKITVRAEINGIMFFI